MRTRALIETVLLAALITSVSCAGPPRAARPVETDPVAGDLRSAISIAVLALHDQAEKPEDFVAVGARQMHVDGKYRWIVTFKLARLLPADPSSDLIALGGDLYASVDLETKSAVIRGGD